jgi:secreted PhoX family phosphatase
VHDKNFTPAAAVGEEPECNPTSNPWFTDIVERRYGRRDVVKGGVAVAVSSFLATSALAHGGNDRGEDHGNDGNARPRRRIDPGYQAVPAFSPGFEDQVVVPEGYSVQVLSPEGAPLAAPYPPYIPGDFNTGADRESQAGAHHDGLHFFPLYRGARGNQSGVLCRNYENIDQAFLHPNGFSRNADGSRPVEDEVRKEMASHGVGVFEI